MSRLLVCLILLLLRVAALQAQATDPVSVVSQFAERYAQEMLRLSPSERAQRMEADDVVLTEGEWGRMQLHDAQTTVLFAERDDRYYLSLKNGDFPLLSLSVPISCQLLTGKSLIALEREFVAGLQTFECSADSLVPTAKDSLERLSEGYYVHRGDHYFLEAIRSDLYWEEREGRLQPLLSTDHPAESAHTLLLAPEWLPSPVTLSLTIRRYGLAREQRDIPLTTLVEYLRQAGCTLYVGIEQLGTQTLKASVFAVHRLLRYNHILRVELPYPLFAGATVKPEASLTLFIPTHNIAGLFEEDNFITNSKQ